MTWFNTALKASDTAPVQTVAYRHCRQGIDRFHGAQLTWSVIKVCARTSAVLDSIAFCSLYRTFRAAVIFSYSQQALSTCSSVSANTPCAASSRRIERSHHQDAAPRP